MPRQKTFDEKTVIKDAMELFWKKGFHQTSIQDLVEDLGVNRASLYETYSDKEGLFNESFILYRNLVQQNIQTIFTTSKNVKDGFNSFIKYFIFDLLHQRNGCLISNTFSELLPTENKKTEQKLEETRLIWRNMIITVLEKAEKQKELKTEINIPQTALETKYYLNNFFIFRFSKSLKLF